MALLLYLLMVPGGSEDTKGIIESAEARMAVFRPFGTDVEQLLERFSSEDLRLYEQLVDHYYILIRAADTIYHSNRLPYIVERLPPFLNALQRAGGAPSIISFNHDLLVEYAMPTAKQFLGLRFSYGLKTRAVHHS